MTVELLHCLGQRVQERKGDLTPAASLLGDVGRVIASDEEAEIRAVQAALASVREKLEHGSDDVQRVPAKTLAGEQSHTFLAGALWAASEVASAHVAHRRSQRRKHAALSGRGALREHIVELLRTRDTATPSDMACHANSNGTPAKLDQVSKALADLLHAGRVRAVEPPPGTDRRYRHFTLAPQPLATRRT